MKANWITIDNIKDEDREWQIDYSKEKGMYRVSEFVDNHFQDEIIFNEVEKENANAYCPICDADRWIPDKVGYCCKCGHHLNRLENHYEWF